MLRKICNALLESILNHILTIKHLRITVGEYTYGLPRFLLGDAVGHGIQPIRYRMLKRWIPLIYQELLWVSVYQNHISRVSFKLLWHVLKIDLNYDQASHN